MAIINRRYATRSNDNDDYSYDAGVTHTPGYTIAKDAVQGVASHAQAIAESHLRGAISSFARGDITGAQLSEVAIRAAHLGVRLEKS